MRDINIDNKRVIVRVDYNVSIIYGIIMNDTRIIKSLKTLNYVIERASKVVILSHIDRIKTEEDKKYNSLKLVYDYLNKFLNKKVSFYDSNMKNLMKK